MELYQKSAVELSAMLRRKDCSAREILSSVYARIDGAEDRVGAYVTLTREKAFEQADAVDAKIAAGEQLHPLAGIPVGVKDNICTKGVATTCSSRMLENFVPPYNATVVERLMQAGMVMTGKLNMDEFAMGSSCETSYFKKTHNPRDLSRVPGGSSGGSAAAVASGEAVVALGSDTGGSIRQPAAYCGVVGLKPTYGTVSRYGLVAFASSLDQIGPMARTVTDTAMLYGVLCGHDRMDATSVLREYPSFTSGLDGNVAGLRIGVPREYFSAGVDASVKEKVQEALSLLERNGAVIREISLPNTDGALAAYYILACAEASSNLARFDGVKYGYRAKDYTSLNDMYEKTRSEGFGDEVKRRILLGTFVLSSGYYDAYYKKAKLFQKKLSAEFEEAFADCDVIATPTAPNTAFRIGENVDDPLKMYASDVCTVTVNIASLPAISVPCGVDAAGLPVGLQLIGSRYSEQTLLRAAFGYETLVGGFDGVAALS